MRLISLSVATLLLSISPIEVPTFTPTVAQAQTRQDGTAQAEELLQEGIDLLGENVEAAVAKFEEALSIYRERGDRITEAEALSKIGDQFNRYSDPVLSERMFDAYQQALAIYREIGETELEARTLQRISDIYFHRREYEKALEFDRTYITLLEAQGDRDALAKALCRLGDRYRFRDLFEAAFEFYQHCLAIRQELGDEIKEAWAWLRLGQAYIDAEQYKPGLESFQEALTRQQRQDNRLGEAIVLETLAWAYLRQDLEAQTNEFLQQSLEIYLELVAEETDTEHLQTIAESLESWDGYWQLGFDGLQVDFYEMRLSLDRKLENREGEIDALESLGYAYLNRGEAETAVEIHQQYLTLHRELNGIEDEDSALLVLLHLYSVNGEFDRGVELSQPYLTFVRESGDREAEAAILSHLGYTAGNAERYDRALEFHQQTLSIYQGLGDSKNQLDPLRNLGEIYVKIGEFDRALEFYDRFLAIAAEVYDRDFVADFLSGYLPQTFFEAEQYDRILVFRQQALEIYRELGDRTSEAQVLQGLGNTYRQLERNEEALELYRQSLAIYRELGDRDREISVLQSLGELHLELQQNRQALETYQQAVAIQQEFGSDIGDEIQLLEQIGNLYLSTGESESALEFHQQYLTRIQATDDRLQEVATLNQLGESYQEKREFDRAIAFYQEALSLSHALQQQPEFAAFDFVGTTMGNLGSLFAEEGRRELAIVFYKGAINDYERIRGEYAGTGLASESEFAKVFLSKREAEYRALADLLLQQDRILEAQQVLDLLKVEELDNYLQDVRGNDSTSRGIPSLPAEREIEAGYQAILDRAIAVGGELSQLRQNDDRTPEEEERLAQLIGDRETLIRDFNAFIDSDDVQTRIAQLSPQTRKPDLVDDLEDLIGLQDNLQNLQQNAVLLYPLILDDRLELILSTPHSPPIRRTVNVSKEELAQTILEFRRALVRPHRPISSVRTPAEQLYQWLIEPLENDLEAANAETILYAPDGQLRYIPLAALHDGDRWLVERYRVNNITAASLTDLNSQPSEKLRVLAGAFTTGEYSLTMGEEVFDFQGLPYAGVEVALLAATVPDTTQLLDAAFNLQDTKPKMGERNVLHFATHGAMVVGTPEESFILFGDGTPATVADVRNWNLNGVDLVVLSACETGLGGNLGSGAEILGLGYQMQRAGAKAAIASLWIVHDGGTQALMNVFYSQLQNGSTKAEALRQAQLAMISGEDLALTQQPEILDAVAIPEELRTNMSDRRLQHPYYWASFILIGNGL